MNVLFIDCDGVLNHDNMDQEERAQLQKKLNDTIEDYTEFSYNVECYKLDMDKKCVDMLSILQEYDVKIVISSTWRLCRYDELIQIFKDWGLGLPVIGKTRLPIKEYDRGGEIKDWLQEHPEVTKFAILDDDGHMRPLTKHLIRTDMETGLQYKHINKLIKIFK